MVDGEVDGDREIMPEQGIIRRSRRTKTLPAKFVDYNMSWILVKLDRLKCYKLN